MTENNRSQIGRKFVLHSVPFPSQEDKEEDKFVLVTIVEVKPGVPGVWGRSDKYEGWRAEDEKGRSYYSTWESFPDDSSSPRWMWDSKDENGAYESWYDVTQGIYDRIPFRPSFLDRPGFNDVVHYCDKHQTLSDIDQSPAAIAFAKSEGFDVAPRCFQCLLKHPPVQPRGWKGWR